MDFQSEMQIWQSLIQFSKMMVMFEMNELFIESFPQMCFWFANRLRADENELTSLLVVDIQGHQRGGFCMSP